MMKKSVLFGTTAATVLLSSALAFAASGPATTYGIDLRQVELCTGNGGGNGCDNPYVLGSSTASFNIASASAGTDVGSYVDQITPPIGVTYTHMRVTLSRTFAISGTITNVANAGAAGAPADCRTGGADATGYTAGTAGFGLNTPGAAAVQNFTLPNAGVFGGQPVYPANFNIPDDNPTMTITYTLTTPITTTVNAPTIGVAFDTQTALEAIGGGNTCIMFPNEPSVTITVENS